MNEILKIQNEVGGELIESTSPPLRFNNPNEFSMIVRVWPPVIATHNNLFVAAVDREMADLANKTEDLIRYRIPVPADMTREEAKVEAIQRMNSLGYRWTPFLRDMDKIKKRIFGFLD